MRLFCLFFICLFGLNACSSREHVYNDVVQQNTPIKMTRHNDHIRAHDILSILVFGEAELSGNYRVSSNGIIDMPLIGSVRVLNLTQADAADKIEVAYKNQNYLIDPNVTLKSSKFIGVMGLNKECFVQCS